ncbi:hypothetical protein D0Z03_000816 [Geotrichum reessii]|nr:hypothetical protein D0Z03_000816 [Galactomyces reessii]
MSNPLSIPDAGQPAIKLNPKPPMKNEPLRPLHPVQIYQKPLSSPPNDADFHPRLLPQQYIPSPPSSYSNTHAASFSNNSSNNSSSTNLAKSLPQQQQLPSFPTSLKSLTANSSLPAPPAPNTSNNPPLNTNSPLALAAAAAVTPEKLANLLLTQGPLPIRHITSHLSTTIPGFGDLSLSKQRRLIIAALDSIDHVNQIRFEKVGWGRWAAKKVSDTAVSGKVAPLTHARKRRESASALAATSGTARPPLSPNLKPLDAHVFLDDGDDDKFSVLKSSPNAASALLAAHNRNRHRRRSSVHRSRMMFKDLEDDEDDDENENAIEDDDEDEDDEEDEEDYAVAGSLELEESVGQRKQPARRHSETDEEDWQSMGAASLRRTSSATSPAVPVSALINNVGDPIGSAPGSNPSSSYNSSLRSTLMGREKDAIAALVQLSSCN